MPDPVVTPVETDPAIAAAQAEVDAAETARLAAEQAAAAPPVVPAVPVVPDTYDLKLPEGTTDAALIERTAAIARELGLGNDAAQTLLNREAASLAEVAQQRTALIDAWKPGGAEFVKRDEQWKAQALAEVAGGDPAKFAVSVEKAQQALAKFGPELKTYLEDTGLGSHPAAIKFLSRVGAAMSEGGMVVGAIGGSPKPKSDAETLYPAHYQTAS